MFRFRQTEFLDWDDYKGQIERLDDYLFRRNVKRESLWNALN